jgi:hypothetical protein
MFGVNRTYHYSPLLRVLSLFGALLAGGILLGSLVAEIEAADLPDLIVHALGLIVSAFMLWLALEFGMRRFTPREDGLHTRLLGEKMIMWNDVSEWREGPLHTRIIIPQRIVVWPFLEDFDSLDDVIQDRVHAKTKFGDQR